MKKLIGMIITLCLLGTGWAHAEQNRFVQSRLLKKYLDPYQLHLRSSTAIVRDNREQVTLYSKNPNDTLAVASITKLMTAIVTLDAKLPMDEVIVVKRSDKDRLKWSRSKLRFGTRLTRNDMLLLTLAASENRAAAALARTYPGGKQAFITAMNRKAQVLGMHKSAFIDPSGLNPGNVASAEDLVTLLETAYYYPTIKRMSTIKGGEVKDALTKRRIQFNNTNRLIRNEKWDISLSKTGFTNDAGYCLVMFTEIEDRPVTIVLLNSRGKFSKYGDANRIRHWLEKYIKRASLFQVAGQY